MSATSATAARWQAGGASGMSPPVLFVIDDDTGVMGALRDDLSRRFGGDFRVSVSRGLPQGWRRCGGWPTGTNRWRCSSSTTT
jgi:hypothetical protein